MRLPRVRFTVRRMMVAIAVLAVPIYGMVLGQRSGDYRRRAALHAARGRSLWAIAAKAPPGVTIAVAGRGSGRGDLTMTHQIASRWVGHYQALARKYEAAAGHPWLPVEPDPPEPE